MYPVGLTSAGGDRLNKLGKCRFVKALRFGRQAQIMPVFISIMLWGLV